MFGRQVLLRLFYLKCIVFNGRRSVPQWEFLELAFVEKVKLHAETSS